MTEYNRGNWSGQEPPFEDGDVVISANCTQEKPGTVICEKVKDLTILGGNFTHCVAQETWTVKGGNWNQIDFAALEAADAAERAAKVAALEVERAKVQAAISSPFSMATAGMTAVVKEGQIVVVKSAVVEGKL